MTKRIPTPKKSDHDLLIEVHEEVKWHRWVLLAILASILSGVRLIDPTMWPWRL